MAFRLQPDWSRGVMVQDPKGGYVASADHHREMLAAITCALAFLEPSRKEGYLAALIFHDSDPDVARAIRHLAIEPSPDDIVE